jgi:PAS domain-containing protein
LPRTAPDYGTSRPPRSAPGVEATDILPLENCVLIMPLESSISGIVVSGDSDLITVGSLPMEVFPTAGFPEDNLADTCTRETLARLGLEGVLPALHGRVLHLIRLSREDSGPVLIAAVVSPDHPAEEVRKSSEIHLHQHRGVLSDLRHIVMKYEIALATALRGTESPVLITDPEGRMVAANTLMVDLIGQRYRSLTGKPAHFLLRLENPCPDQAPPHPQRSTFVTPLFISARGWFFTSEIAVSEIDTVCGRRLVTELRDLYIDQRRGNSNISLIQRLAELVASGAPPQAVLRRLVNAVTASLSSEITCILRFRTSKELIVTPYCNRHLETLPVNLISLEQEPVLEGFTRDRHPVICEDPQRSCPPESFFRRIGQLSRFALMPVTPSPVTGHALFCGWSETAPPVDVSALPLLRVITHLTGTTLRIAGLVGDLERERDSLRRYTRLTAARELAMAELKRENASLNSLLVELGSRTEARDQ